jgi:hypothetical protein
VKNVSLGHRTIADIDGQVDKVLRGLGNPEPPVDLRVVRDLLKLDRGYYSTSDDSLLRETFSRLKVAGLQVLLRPTILRDAVRSLSLKALYLPDQKRILLDQEALIVDAARRVHRCQDIVAWGLMVEAEGGRDTKLWNWYRSQGFKPVKENPEDDGPASAVLYESLKIFLAK